MSKKEIAIAFLKMAAFGDVKAAFNKFVAPEFVHHNQYFRGDRASLVHAMEEAHKINPNKLIDVRQAFEDGDTVITHSLVKRKNPEEPDCAVVHIFKFEQDQVVELWDLGQELLKDSPNENGPF